MAKLPLENHALERAVLGTLISDTSIFWNMKARARPELFVVPMHGRICKVLHTLVEDGRELTVPGIISRLTVDDNDQGNNNGFNVGGYLATLLADEADPSNLPHDFADLEEMFGRREMARLGAELIRQSTEDNGLDALGRLEQAKDSLNELTDPMGSSVRHVMQIAQGVITRLSDATMNEQPLGLNVGLKSVQDLTGAFMPKRLYLLAGPPGSGKTGLAYQIAAYSAREVPTLFVSIEMGDEELVERDLAGETGIEAERIERAAVNDAEIDRIMDAAGTMADLKLYIDASTGPTVSSIRAKAMRMKRLKGLGLLVIDHLLYIQNSNKNEFAGIRENMQGLKKLAKDLGIPVLLLSQLKKEFGEGPWQQMRRPNVNDLYGGSAPEQESDVVLFVHREEYLLGRKEPAQGAKDRSEWELARDNAAGKAELVLTKRRGGKGFGTRTFYFDGPKVRFSDQAPRITFPRSGFATQGNMLDAADHEFIAGGGLDS